MQVKISVLPVNKTKGWPTSSNNFMFSEYITNIRYDE